MSEIVLIQVLLGAESIQIAFLLRQRGRESDPPRPKSLLLFPLFHFTCLCSCKSEMCHFLTGSSKPWKYLTRKKKKGICASADFK